MIKTDDNIPDFHRPKWIRVLLIVTGLLVILRLAGVIQIPDEWFIGAVIIELGLIVFELTAFVVIFRYFYRRQRQSGQDKLDALAHAQVNELRAAGLPAKIAMPLQKAMLWEMNIYRKVYSLLKHLIRRP